MAQASNYEQSGVSIDTGNELVERIKPMVKATQNPNVIGGIGGFAGLFRLDLEKFPRPVLVSGTDGVGTKLKIASMARKHDTVGIDLVAMCANDLVTMGATPLFFLDYYATGRLTLRQGEDLLQGITTGCEMAGCALVGGETAEMPGMYQGEDYDLAGFIVGCVNEEEIIDGKSITTGDVVLACPSSGFHSNGFSLIRKVCFDDLRLKLDEEISVLQKPLGEILLEPTKIYVNQILQLLESYKIKGMAHITGGGVVENIPRVLPPGKRVKWRDWEWPAVFQWFQEVGNIPREEMLRVFNCGMGMAMVVSPEVAKQIQAHASEWQIIGEIH